MSYIAFGVVMIKVLLNDVVWGQFTFGTIDAAVIAALLTPTLGAYAIRRRNDPPRPPVAGPDTGDNGLGGG